MGWFEGMLGGFAERKGVVEAENIRRAELASDREAKIYEALLASPDAEIQALAATGLLESAQPKKRAKGLRGWMGELETSPTFTELQRLIQTPVMTKPAEPGARGLPSRQITPQIPTAPPQGAPAGTPATSMTEPGAPPPIAISYQETPGPLVGRPPTPATYERRRVFRTPEEEMLMMEEARGRGGVRGRVAGRIEAGFTPQEARELERRQLRAGAASRSIFGEAQDAQGNWYSTTVTFNPVTETYEDLEGKPVRNFRRSTTTGSTSMGADRESLSREMFGKRPTELTANEMAQLNDRLLSFSGERAGAVTTGRGVAAADIPLSTQKRFDATVDLQDKWRKLQAPIREMERQYHLMQTGLNRFGADPIGGSQAVLVTFQKILDPTSVVRESEYARSPQGLSLVDRLSGMYDRYIGQYDPETGKWIGGGAGVPKPILAEMVETARQFLQGMQGWNDAQSTLIRETATSYGIDPRLVFESGTAVGTPPPGAEPPPPARGRQPSIEGQGLFMGADGQLHLGSTTGPIYKPGG